MSLPTVSIGMPVRNGAEYLRVALDSLLAQDYRDFELIVSDNASNDETARICREYAEKDARIRCFHGDVKVGAAENFNRVFRYARGKYFMWAAHDDRWHPSYVGRCLEGLEGNLNVVLCASGVNFVDRHGAALDTDAPLRRAIGDYNRLHTVSMGLYDRVKELTRRNNWFAFYGLTRTEALRKTGLFPDTFGGDVLLLMELLFHGETMILPDALFDYRVIEKSPERQLETIRGICPGREKLRPCTQLAKNLLQGIEGSAFSAEIKSRLREDLLENVSFANAAWAIEIQVENQATMGWDNHYFASIQIRDLLEGRRVRPATELKDLAFEKFLCGLPISRRARQRIQHWLGKYVLWRLRPWA